MPLVRIKRALVCCEADWQIRLHTSETLVLRGEISVRVIIETDSEAASRRAAKFVADLVRKKPNCVLGLATGSTPQATYRELIRLHRDEGLDFSQMTTFNLDEYVGLSSVHPQSYRQFMQANLFDHINIREEATNVPDGRALDFESHCRQYEQWIHDAGGIDLQILGIGANGHIGFNEPGSSFDSRTRIVALADDSRAAVAAAFVGEAVPTRALTIGIATILAARRCVLLAFGAGKAGVIGRAIEDPPTPEMPASALQLHPDATIVLDAAAAFQLG